MNISLSSRSDELQSLSFPGSVRRLDVALLQTAHSCWAARLASRARADRITLAMIDSATLMFVFSQCSSAGRTCEPQPTSPQDC